MIERFSIVNSLDINKLAHMAYKYVREAKGEKPYIFMSEDTALAVESECGNIPFEPTANRSRNRNGFVALFDGYKVFANNDMKFGDIEIR